MGTQDTCCVLRGGGLLLTNKKVTLSPIHHQPQHDQVCTTVILLKILYPTVCILHEDVQDMLSQLNFTSMFLVQHRKPF